MPTLPALTERAFQSQVIALADLRKWMVFHPADNIPVISAKGRRYVQDVRAGWPDLFMVRGRRMIAAELKRERGKTSAEQDQWLAALALAGCETYIWRPAQMTDGTIAACLR